MQVRTIVFTVSIAFIAALAGTGCGHLPLLDRQESATAVPTVPVARSLATATPTPTLTPTPTPTTTPTPAQVDEAAAEQMVRDYFQALDDGDYERLRLLATGQAAVVSAEIARQVQEAERTNGVALDAAVTCLEIVNAERQGASVEVGTDFGIAINARAGPFSFKVRETSGQADFLVEPVSGEPRITEIRGNLID
ncbi:MAG: hypothetical protein M0Z94_17465 [Dehalococcoidales bacterium]|nr:hypothetical protein [Dehalococcoidales bacterium]